MNLVEILKEKVAAFSMIKPPFPPSSLRVLMPLHTHYLGPKHLYINGYFLLQSSNKAAHKSFLPSSNSVLFILANLRNGLMKTFLFSTPVSYPGCFDEQVPCQNRLSKFIPLEPLNCIPFKVRGCEQCFLIFRFILVSEELIS